MKTKFLKEKCFECKIISFSNFIWHIMVSFSIFFYLKVLNPKYSQQRQCNSENHEQSQKSFKSWIFSRSLCSSLNSSNNLTSKNELQSMFCWIPTNIYEYIFYLCPKRPQIGHRQIPLLTLNKLIKNPHCILSTIRTNFALVSRCYLIKSQIPSNFSAYLSRNKVFVMNHDILFLLRFV